MRARRRGRGKGKVEGGGGEEMKKEGRKGLWHR
jgi:hypothetical protein